MNKKTYLKQFSIVLAIISALSSCSDILETPPLTQGEGRESAVTIYIPNVEGAFAYGRTRADGEATNAKTAQVLDSEATIKNLYLVAVNSDEEESSFEVIDLKAINSTDKTGYGDSWTPYTIDKSLKPGNYNLYVVGNLDKYLGYDKKITDLTSEEELQEIILDFSEVVEQGTITKDELPMACMALRRGNASANPSLKQEVASGTTELYANMTFLCSKVRYTILFDNTENGISKNLNGSVIDFEQPVAHNIRKTTPLIYTTETESAEYIDPTNIELIPVVYPTEENYPVYDETQGKTSDNLNPLGDNAMEDNQRAWQGVIYLPENMPVDENVSYIEFTGVFDKGSSLERSFNRTIFLRTEEYGLKRGHLYDYRAEIVDGTPEIKLTVNVSDWNLKTLAYQLHGAYELVLEKTDVEVHSGVWSDPIWYRSDVAPVDIEFEYPQYEIRDGEYVNFYEAQVMKDESGAYVVNGNGDYMIRVRVNPDIPYSKVSDLSKEENKEQKDALSYFHVVAGALHKKIEVTPLILAPFLNVTPQDILIDVRHYISSGINEGVVEIAFETNVTDAPIILTYSGQGTIINSFNNALYIEGEEGVTVSEESGIFKIDKHNNKLLLNLKKLFDGESYWESEHTYTLTFHVDTPQSYEGEPVKDVTVSITVRPSTTDYIIHFKNISDAEWKQPHIYVYQCLELPSDLKGDNSEYGGVTVGYKDGDNNLAALEYAFTSGYSFKGWYGYGGPIENDPNAAGYGPDQNPWTKGFFIFGTGGESSTIGQEYKASNTNTAHYNVDGNFNDAHISRINSSTYGWKCESCRKEGWKNHMWPGIIMEQEEDGWWRYTLSGVATPGKAMIMFNDDHNNDNYDTDVKRRYPANNEVGVPLFDFPDNEGWFVFDGISQSHGLNFYPTKPVTTTTGITAKARLYWPKSIGKYIHLWNSGGPGTVYTDWGATNGSNQGKEDSSVDGYWYLEFDYTDKGALHIIYRADNGDKICDDSKPAHQHFINMIDFQYVDGMMVAWGDENHVFRGGLPVTQEEQVEGNWIRFYWPAEKGEGIYMGIDKKTIVEYGTLGLVYNDSWNYLDIEVDKLSGVMEYKFSNPEEPAGGGNYYLGEVTASSFQLGEDGYYHAYVTKENPQNLSAGLPTTGSEVVKSRFEGREVITMKLNTERNYIYMWFENDFGVNEITGIWPGAELTNEDGDGYKTFTFIMPSSIGKYPSSYIKYILNDYSSQDADAIMGVKSLELNDADGSYTFTQD